MPIFSTITAISGNQPDIAQTSDKYFLEKNLLYILIGIFSLTASRSYRICKVRQPRLVNKSCEIDKIRSILVWRSNFYRETSSRYDTI